MLTVQKLLAVCVAVAVFVQLTDLAEAVVIDLDEGSAAASSDEGGSNVPPGAFDDNSGTRWASTANDNQWVYVDLGAEYSLNQVQIDWETAYSANYSLLMRTATQGVDVSVNPANWTEVASITGRTGVNGSGGSIDDTFDFNAQTYTANNGSTSGSSVSASPKGRYLMMYGTTRATGWGHSIWEVDVDGDRDPTWLDLDETSAVASSQENSGAPPSNAFDGNTATRWSSARTDNEWIYIDLGNDYPIGKVLIDWETANSLDYTLRMHGRRALWVSWGSAAS